MAKRRIQTTFFIPKSPFWRTFSAFWRIRPKEVNAHFPAGGFKLKVIRFFFCMLRVLFILFAKNLSYMLHCILIIKSFASFKYLSWKTFSVSSCPYVQKKYSLSRAICLCLIVRIKGIGALL